MNYADLMRRLTCRYCRHSASDHEDEGCMAAGCSCVDFESLPPSHLPTTEGEGRE